MFEYMEIGNYCLNGKIRYWFVLSIVDSCELLLCAVLLVGPPVFP